MKLFFLILLITIVGCQGDAQHTKNANVERSFKNILQIGETTLSAKDYQKLYAFLQDTLKKNENINEASFLVSQNFLDFMYASNVYIYGYLDWEEPRESLENFAKKTLINTFGDTVSYISPLKLNNNITDNLQQINFASTRLIGKYLIGRGYSLCNIDCSCDCYRLILVRSKDLEILQNSVSALGCQLELHEQEW